MGKTVVTGGAGFIGSHLVKALLDEGSEVHVIDNYAGGRREDRLHERAAYHDLDIRECGKLLPVMDGAECVFHLAALPRVQYSIEEPLLTSEVNVRGTEAVLRAASEKKVRRVVYAASSSAYGDQDSLPLHEDLAAAPKSPYGYQKYVGELACRMWSEVYELPTVSLRYFNVYGAGFDPEGAYALVIGKFIRQRSEGGPMTVTGDGTQTRDFTHVRGVVRANLLAARSSAVGRGEVINIGRGMNVTISRIAELIGGPVEYIPPRLEPHDTLADISKAKEFLGWEPQVPLEAGVAELKEEYGLA